MNYEPSTMNYSLAKKKLETLLASEKRSLQKYAGSKGASEGAVFKRTEMLNTIINYFNAAEEKIAAPANVASGDSLEGAYIRDTALETAILEYFGLNIPNTYPVDRVARFCEEMHRAGQLEYFKKQFKNYCAYKKIAGFTHGFYSFLGREHMRFVDGKWNAENWGIKLSELKPAMNGKNYQRGDTPKNGYGII